MLPQTNTPSKGMTAWLIRMGIAKDARSANIVLLIVATVALLLAGWLLWGKSSSNSNYAPLDTLAAVTAPR